MTQEPLTEPRSFFGGVRLLLAKPVPLSALLLIAAVLLVPQFLPGIASRLLLRQDKALEGIELRDFIVKVKADLAAAEKEGLDKGERPLLQLQDVELVANFVVQSKASSEVQLITVNGSALSGLERSQRITLHLRPIPPEQMEVKPETAPITTNGPLIGPSEPPKEERP